MSKKISQFPQITTRNDNDWLLVEEVSTGAYKKIKISDLVASAIGGNKGALNFAGYNTKFVSVPYKVQFLTIPFTIEALIEIPNSQSLNGIFGNGSGTANGAWELRIEDLNKLNLVKYGIIDQRITLPISLAVGTPYRISVVQTASQVQYYIDGTLAGSFSNTSAFRANQIFDFYIGKGREGNSNLRIDDVRFWSAARTQAEINTYKTQELIGNEANLFAYWKFNERVGTTASDSTVNNNNGTLINDPTYVESLL